MPIYVRVDFEIQVSLPEGIPEEWEDGQDETCPPAIRERAIEAALGFISQSGEVYIDGEDKPGARIFVDLTDHDVTEVRAEE